MVMCVVCPVRPRDGLYCDVGTGDGAVYHHGIEYRDNEITR